jgi:hypothetical protein
MYTLHMPPPLLLLYAAGDTAHNEAGQAGTQQAHC